MRNNKKKIVLLCVLCVLGILIPCTFFARKSLKNNEEGIVYVESVSSINQLGSGSGLFQRYSGIVEPQETTEVKQNMDRVIKDVYVKVGDLVEEGTPLFSYETGELELQLSHAELELERLSASITDLNEQVGLLNNASVGANELSLEHKAQILTTQNELKQAEYDRKSKQVEVEQLKSSVENSVVKSTVTGVVKSIGGDATASEGNGESYMTLLSMTNYRIKGTVSEQSVSQLQVEQPVIIRSRVNKEQTWKGKITMIDLNNMLTPNDLNMGGSSEVATNYPFYVELESTENLILGQHVYVELDEGQDQSSEGIWLYDYYLMNEDDKSYVYVENDQKLEKREVQLGAYDEQQQRYEILDGLTGDDYIAFPDEQVKEGITCEKMQNGSLTEVEE